GTVQERERPAYPRARRLQAADVRAGRRGSNRARGTRAQSRPALDADADVVDLTGDGRLQLAHLDHHAVDARLGPAYVGDARRKPFEQLVVLVGDHAAHRVANRPVVDRVRQGVAGTRRREIDEELEVDPKRLGPLLLLGQHAVHTHLAQSGNQDAIHVVNVPGSIPAI